jgi:hypothetical protein
MWRIAGNAWNTEHDNSGDREYDHAWNKFA